MAQSLFVLLLAVCATTAGPAARADEREKKQAPSRTDTPEDRAIAYLAREVPQWKQEHRCFSCHNNGDGARALFVAIRAGIAVDPAATRDTLAWLATPSAWEANGPPGPFNDLKLARLQFANTLVAAVDARLVPDKRPLVQAAELLVTDQIGSGSWDFAGADELGSPVIYGRPLATALAVRVLRRADAQRFAQPIAAADNWLRSVESKSVLNSAAILIGLGQATDAASNHQRERCLDILRRGEAAAGGWGPYVDSAPEPFDTAIVLCALAELQTSAWRPAMQRGREYLRRTQLSDGSWPETTRPAARESYAHRISTTAWSTAALLATRNLEQR